MNKFIVPSTLNILSHFRPSKNGFTSVEDLREIFNQPLRLYEHNFHTSEIKQTNHEDGKLCEECGLVPGEHLHHSELLFGEMCNFAVNIALQEDIEEVYASKDLVLSGVELKDFDIIARAFSWFYEQKLVRFQWLCPSCHAELHNVRQNRYGPIRRYLHAIDRLSVRQ